MTPSDRNRFRLTDDVGAALADLAARHGYASAREPARLGAEVRALSDIYNEMAAGVEVASSARSHLGARLSFSLPRDMAKGASAVRELISAGLIRGTTEKGVRVLDVGAGLGAMTFGLATALANAGSTAPIDALLLDADGEALRLAKEVAPIVAGSRTDLRVATSPLSVRELGAVRTAFELIFLGQVLSELDPTLAPEARLTRHLELIRALANKLTPDGSLVIVEPALRNRTRHLHALRDAILGVPWANVFAPCVHLGLCPALATEGDWCHDDLAIDLPEWLVPTAKAAGLRWEGLTFSYLVLRKDGKNLRGCLAEPNLVRVVSSLLKTKGKSEAFLCGDFANAEGEGGVVSSRSKLRRLDRDAQDGNDAWERIERGDLIGTPAPLPLGGRVKADMHVSLATWKAFQGD